jgi:hypothetical protein
MRRINVNECLENQIAIMSKLEKHILTIMFFIGTGISLIGQVPNWVDPAGYPNTMTGTFKISDECVPSNDAQDIVAVFDIDGNIRGVKKTDNNNRAFLTIRGEVDGQLLYFKVYDHSTDKVYNIYNTSISFSSGGRVATPSDPMILNFDSNPMDVSAGPYQEVFNKSFTTLAATGVGMWSIVEGAGGSFVDATNPTTIFNGIIGKHYVLAWTLDNAAGCIGETAEVIIDLVLDEPENGTRTCNDGLDNDGDGRYDCGDPDCGQPVITDISYIPPTPINCASTEANGSFTVIQTGADLFSKDGGTTTQMTPVFSGLVADSYDVFLKNSVTGCSETTTAVVQNTLDEISGITEINVMGPEILCMGLQDVNYSLDITPVGTLTWAYTGTGATITKVGAEASVDFVSTATAGGIIAKIASACSSRSDTLQISFASMFLCGFSNCPPMVNISSGVLQSLNSPQVYRAGMTLNSNAEVINYNYEFTAGKSLIFENGFSVARGLNFIADIKNCNK